MTCAFPDCEREATRAGLCHGHRWQREHGRPLTPLAPRGQDPREQLRVAALAYAEAETDEEFDSAGVWLEMAARAFVLESPACNRANCDRRKYRDGLCFNHWQSRPWHPQQARFGFLVPDVPGAKRVRLPAGRKLRLG